jgi:hypothetical protein
MVCKLLQTWIAALKDDFGCWFQVHPGCNGLCLTRYLRNLRIRPHGGEDDELRQELRLLRMLVAYTGPIPRPGLFEEVFRGLLG